MNRLTIKSRAADNAAAKQPASHYALAVISLLCLLMSLAGCASPSAQLPPPAPKYVYETDDQDPVLSANSLWKEDGNLFEDRKARKINDLVTILVIESLSGTGKADTDTSRESTADFNLDNLFGMNTDFNLQNAWLLKNMYRGTNVFEPVVEGSGSSEFKGAGDTSREGTLSATITAKVVEVMPNGNLVLAARKEMTINQEKQILVFSGIARPDDISSSNTIASNKVADARIFYVGDGVIQDKQKPGWLVRVLDNTWPF